MTLLGGLKSTPCTQGIGEGVQGLAFVDYLYTARSRLLARLLEARTRTAKLGRVASSEHPAVLRCVYFPTRPLKCSHRCIGIVTDFGSRPYMVGGPPCTRTSETNSGFLGITMARKWKLACLREKAP